jgi:hypothetical protein
MSSLLSQALYLTSFDKKLFGEIGIRNKLKICPQFEMSVQVLQ